VRPPQECTCIVTVADLTAKLAALETLLVDRTTERDNAEAAYKDMKARLTAAETLQRVPKDN
jgi:hypothetical protein